MTDHVITGTLEVTVPDPNTPVAIGGSNTWFSMLTVIGYKAPRTPNTGTVWLQVEADTGSIGIPIEPGQVASWSSPGDKAVRASDFYIDVANADDGAMIIYSI